MQSNEHSWIYLAVIGLIIGIGRLCVSNEKLTARLIIGRSILGGATSSVAGVALMQFPSMPLPVLIGIGAALGIAGSGVIEAYINKKVEG